MELRLKAHTAEAEMLFLKQDVVTFVCQDHGDQSYMVMSYTI